MALWYVHVTMFYHVERHVKAYLNIFYEPHYICDFCLVHLYHWSFVIYGHKLLWYSEVHYNYHRYCEYLFSSFVADAVLCDVLVPFGK